MLGRFPQIYTVMAATSDTLNSSYVHSWDVSPREAVSLQRKLSRHVIRSDRLGAVRRVAGIDVGYEKGGQLARAAAVVLEYPSLQVCEKALIRRPVRFPYIPGLLSFREVPAALAALQALKEPPDLLLCDGQGYAHPRRFGLACHLGLLADIPAIGVGKTRLCGVHDAIDGARGDWAPLRDRGQLIGAVLCTRPGFKPIYISSGHRISLRAAIRYVMGCTTRFRLPETTRAAHRLASGN